MGQQCSCEGGDSKSEMNYQEVSTDSEACRAQVQVFNSVSRDPDLSALSGAFIKARQIQTKRLTEEFIGSPRSLATNICLANPMSYSTRI